MVQPTKEETLAKMDADAKLAREEFKQMAANSDRVTFDASVGLIAAWWEKWYPKAGHKRLAYILMGKPMNHTKNTSAPDS